MRDAHKPDLKLSWPPWSPCPWRLHEHVEKADPQRDGQVESIKVPENHVWGAEDDTTPLVSRPVREGGGGGGVKCDSSGLARSGVVCSKDHCADVVDLFPHANTPKTVETWKMDDATRKAWEAQHKRRIHDDRLMEDIHIVMELKVNELDQALADAQLYRRYYRMISTKGI
ncbi:BQ5605_C009g05431 [Microbotryum silenes-dioicae]|uniref:BQ5605_C009g05431 protein n=1 Tax=Microbotryum silenes-dioicae TaxID=796604 RepID=A0A2X0MH60_9BASI|nr:BQ5605_C009g05431 [Microbotryum silenes-dioicae]